MTEGMRWVLILIVALWSAYFWEFMGGWLENNREHTHEHVPHSPKHHVHPHLPKPHDHPHTHSQANEKRDLRA